MTKHLRDEKGAPTELLARFLDANYIGSPPRDLVRQKYCFHLSFSRHSLKQVEAFLESLRPQFEDWKRAAPSEIKVFLVFCWDFLFLHLSRRDRIFTNSLKT